MCDKEIIDMPLTKSAIATFKYSLTQLVALRISNEYGTVKGRAEYQAGNKQYYIHYLAADGCAKTEWFAESDLIAVKDTDHPGHEVYGVNAEDMPKAQ